MSSSTVKLFDPNVEPTAAQFDAVAKAALKKALSRQALAQQRFQASLELGVKRALADKEQRRRAR
jgi:hypothetical protein